MSEPRCPSLEPQATQAGRMSFREQFLCLKNLEVVPPPPPPSSGGRVWVRQGVEMVSTHGGIRIRMALVTLCAEYIFFPSSSCLPSPM